MDGVPLSVCVPLRLAALTYLRRGGPPHACLPACLPHLLSLPPLPAHPHPPACTVAHCPASWPARLTHTQTSQAPTHTYPSPRTTTPSGGCTHTHSSAYADSADAGGSQEAAHE